MQTVAPILKVENLTVHQGQYLAVRDVSFELMPGTDTALVGPNGAGKTTLILALLGLLPYTSGQIEILGCPLSRLGAHRHEIGYVPQNFVFDRSFPISVYELLATGWVNPRSPRVFQLPWSRSLEQAQAIDQALNRVDAYHLRNRAIGNLSLGQLKRVLLAYCLLLPRKLLILDEVFAGIDSQGEAEFYNLLKELKQEQNWTILQISHDLTMVSRHCDRVLCLNQVLVCQGHPEVALSPENLLAVYGPAFSPYHHHHH